VKDLKIQVVSSISEINGHMTRGNKARKTASTAMNDQSSRSHSVFTIYIETSETVRTLNHHFQFRSKTN
jgi:kinesin family protein 3/17